jgi:hypothetical protein
MAAHTLGHGPAPPAMDAVEGTRSWCSGGTRRGVGVRDEGRKEGWGPPLPSSTSPPGEGEAPSARASHWCGAPAPPPPRRLPPSPLHVHLAASTPRRWSSAAATVGAPWSLALRMRVGGGDGREIGYGRRAPIGVNKWMRMTHGSHQW